MTKLFGTDPSFYPSPSSAMEAPPETLAYVALLKPDGLGVVDLNPASPAYGRIVYRLDLPGDDDELHHFGWNACSSALCPTAFHPQLERRYLIIPGIRSSRIYIADTKPDPRRPKIIRTIEPAEIKKRTGYSRPHTVHCGPEGIFISALGAGEGSGGPGGIFLLDHFNFNVLGAWEMDRGPQHFSYDFWWHIAHDVTVTSGWATPDLFEDGLKLDALLQRKYGHSVHFFDSRTRSHIQEIDFGDQHQMVLELRPAHDPRRTYGFASVVIDVTNLASSIWVWFRDNGKWAARKVIEIPAVPAEADQLPPALKDVGAVPPLVTDMVLSLDDRFLYVSCWGTGALIQYDVSDPFNPVHVDTVQIGGIINPVPHPSGKQITGGPQMVELSRDGRRAYFTNSLYRAWDDQFYTDGIKGAMIKVNIGAEGGMEIDADFLVEFGDTRAHQIRLEGGDCSTDTFCYP
ncbi:selenium-binding protein SBP56-related protein [Bacillus sp. T33-2]|uniref:selenium-binding protein SBP56-related protein n=1 Tax=Bacillus sp. T33-2 TaxID=2054168 RepID=UPI000C792748|nr:selenium-binding protein SBP56-related protein [Bacillus sp. T33-2]PLR98463.1 selenium-binding protein [Bacillus sp. T33-2]